VSNLRKRLFGALSNDRGQLAHCQPARPSESFIEFLAKQDGLRVIWQEGTRYRLIDDEMRLHPVAVRYHPDWPSTTFQAWLPVQFRLDSPPAGLFPQLLLHNYNLIFAAWTMNITDSCETSLSAAARLPSVALASPLFGEVCRELMNEVEAFHQELRGKFKGADAAGHHRVNVSDLPGKNLPPGRNGDIRFLER
jgi:hypothetical protein